MMMMLVLLWQQLLAWHGQDDPPVSGPLSDPPVSGHLSDPPVSGPCSRLNLQTLSSCQAP
jgi:hypothetical protein